MSKIEFKEFVKKNPKLIKYVKNDQMSWQKFYEMYELYGEDKEAWKDYLTEEKTEIKKEVATSVGLSEVVNWMKNINLDGLQEGINNVQRVLGVFQDFTKKDSSDNKSNNEYKPRPLYKHFED